MMPNDFLQNLLQLNDYSLLWEVRRASIVSLSYFSANLLVL